MSKKDFIESVFLALDPSVSAKEIQKAANVSYQKLPKDDKAFLALCEKLLEVTPTYIKYISLWIKRRKLYDFSYFVVYEQWLKTYVDGWAWCDQFCYRVLNPMLEQHYTQVKEHVFAWCHDANVLVNRAAIVCLLYSGDEFAIHLPLAFVYAVIDEVEHKENRYIRMAIGWILKYAYLKDRDSLISYVQQHSFDPTVLSRVKEKMCDEDKLRIAGNVHHHAVKTKED